MDSYETAWAQLARKEWRAGFWAGIWLSVTVFLLLMALLATVGTHIIIGK